MGEIHAGHTDHKLVLKNYTCDDYKELGIGSQCWCKDCEYDLHKHYMFYKSTTRHDFFPQSAFKFIIRPSGKHERRCNGCRKPMRGFVYHCKEEGWDLHPSCMYLLNKLKVDYVKFKLQDKVMKKCFCCNKRRLEGSVYGIRGCSYVSKCKKYHIHV